MNNCQTPQQAACGNMLLEVFENKEVLRFYFSDVGERGLSDYELAVANGFSGTLDEWLESLVGPPVPVAQELGDDPNLAVSQKLLKDSIDSMEQSNSEAVAEAERLNNLSQQAASSAAESESNASDSAESANSSALSAAQSERESASSAEQSLQSANSSESSAQSASSSAQSASASASSAGVSAEQAALSAVAADDSASKAKQSELAALSSAQSSEASANSASGSAAQAEQSAQSAASSAQSAADSESSASSSKDAAEASAQSASDSADRAEQAATIVEDKLDKSAVKDELGDSLEFVINQRRVTQELMNIIAWIDIPKQIMMADFTKQRYALNGKPCRFEDIFEFERLSKAWLWDSNRGMIEFEINIPRLTSNGLRIEPESTNFLIDSFLLKGRAGMQTFGGDLFFGVDKLGPHIHFKQTSNYNYAYKNYRDLTADEGSHSLTFVSDTSGLSWGSSGASLQVVGISASKLNEVFTGVYSGKAVMQDTGQQGSNRGLIKRPAHDTTEPKFYLYQLEDYPEFTSPIRTEMVPTTRLPETISTTIPQGHTISGDWDDTLTIEVVDGKLVHSGIGYIRKLILEKN